MGNTKIKVLYCMGSGRSGSTLLGIILGNHVDLFSPGEINGISRLKSMEFKCSCQSRVEECEFWEKVIGDWTEEVGKENVMNTLLNFHKIENFKSPKSWKAALSKTLPDYIVEHLNINYDLFKAMLRHSKKNIIVDISKNPLRAYLLSRHPDIDLRVIHLVRDGRGVAWSLNKFVKKEIQPKPAWRTAIFWTIVNLQSNYVRKNTNSIRINYEDLAKNTNVVLDRIAKLAEIDPDSIVKYLNEEIVVEGSHIMAGNKLRKANKIKIKIDESWKKGLSTSQKRVFSLIAGRLMKSYGY